MLTYEYECGSCHHRFERDQSINDKPVSKCPKCGKTPHRLISGGSGFIWKGGDNGPGRFSTYEDSSPVETPKAACRGKVKGRSCGKKSEKSL